MSTETQKSAGRIENQHELRQKMRKKAQKVPLTKEGKDFLKKAQKVT
ncbi:MAG: hypothetical protein AB2689_01875 [Candidatus Thiodiazotropha taylori]